MGKDFFGKYFQFFYAYRTKYYYEKNIILSADWIDFDGLKFNKIKNIKGDVYDERGNGKIADNYLVYIEDKFYLIKGVRSISSSFGGTSKGVSYDILRVKTKELDPENNLDYITFNIKTVEGFKRKMTQLDVEIFEI